MSLPAEILEGIKGVLHDLAAAAGALHLHEQIDQLGKDAVTDGEGLAKEAGTDLAADVSRETGPAETTPTSAPTSGAGSVTSTSEVPVTLPAAEKPAE
jgi:hypothetical protein